MFGKFRKVLSCPTWLKVLAAETKFTKRLGNSNYQVLKRHWQVWHLRHAGLRCPQLCEALSFISVSYSCALHCLKHTRPAPPPHPPTLPIFFFRVQVEPWLPINGAQVALIHRRRCAENKQGRVSESLKAGVDYILYSIILERRSFVVEEWADCKGGVGWCRCTVPQQSCQDEVQLSNTHTHTKPRRKTAMGAAERLIPTSGKPELTGKKQKSKIWPSTISLLFCPGLWWRQNKIKINK